MTKVIQSKEVPEACPACNGFSVGLHLESGYIQYKCPLCGEFFVTFRASQVLRDAVLSDRQRANISGWLRENQGSKIEVGQVEQLGEISTPSFNERADKLLFAIEKQTTHAGQLLPKNDEWMSWGWCLNEQELIEVLKYLEESRRVVEAGRSYKIAPIGWAHLDDLRKKGADSQQGFVAMWFKDGMKPFYDNVISKAIEDAGYKPHRVDQRDHAGKVDDEIIAQIRRSRFVVADFTGHRGGVYYEAGFAKGLGLEVIWTCNEKAKKELHFDIRQYNCIFWENGKPEEFRKQLANRIESVLGHGTYKVR